MPSAFPLLQKLGLSDAESRLYVALIEHGALTAGELTKLTHAKRPTVYYALRQLTDRGLIHKSGSVGVERYQAEKPEALTTLLKLKHRELDALEEEVTEILPQLAPSTVHREGTPAVSFYEGEAAMKQAIMETLYCRNRHIDSIAPAENFFWQIGQTFSAQYIKERVQRKITTRNLWEQPLEPTIMVKSYAGLSQVRILPQTMHGRFRTTVFLYDDQVMYIASRKSGYALVVKSKEHHELMLSMFDTMWETSTRSPSP